jgi:hypothetical protein
MNDKDPGDIGKIAFWQAFAWIIFLVIVLGVIGALAK